MFLVFKAKNLISNSVIAKCLDQKSDFLIFEKNIPVKGIMMKIFQKLKPNKILFISLSHFMDLASLYDFELRIEF
jgi:hypothetical protein